MGPPKFKTSHVTYAVDVCVVKCELYITQARQYGIKQNIAATQRILLVAVRSDQWHRLPAWGFLLVFRSNRIALKRTVVEL